MTTYKNALKALKNDRCGIIYSDDIILLKSALGYSLVRNGLVQQTRFKTVSSLMELEDEWMNKEEEVEYKAFEAEADAVFMFGLMVTAATHRDIVL